MTNTERLGLFKVPSDPAEQGITNFNTDTMMNENWEKIDAKVAVLGPDGKIPSDQIDVDTSKLATKQEVQNVDEKVATHLAESMPHQFVDSGKTYCWGFRTLNGQPQFIYEEVI